jgi:cyclophilin family peptidyl-prolyl cis-trans isomerase
VFGQTASERPVVFVETSKGLFAFEMFPGEAPMTVAHVLALVKRGFYDGQRVHKAVTGFVVQFGDPQTRDLDLRELWGLGPGAGSGTAVGGTEISPKRLHLKGSVGMAHMGDPAKADSQIYVTLESRPDLDGHYAVFGQVVDGFEVIEQLRAGDEIRRVYVREERPEGPGT